MSIGHKIATGAIWMLLFKIAERSLGFVSTIILARLLLPADFGIIAMAMSIVAILELLSAFNFDVVLIQNQDAERRHYDTAWTFNVIFGVVSALLLILLAIPTAKLYNEPRLDTVMYVLAIAYMIQGFENIGVVAFRKDMEFNKEFKFLLLKKVISFSVTVPLAFILQNYWALVIGILSGMAAGVLLSYFVHPYRPKLSLEARHELFNFSKWLLFNNVLYFARLRSADFIIGRFEGSHGLGLYNIAFEISNMPTTHIIAPVNRAVFPGYAKLSSNLKDLRNGFLNVYSAMLIFIFPTAIGILLTADLIVLVFLGEKWIEIIPLIKILSVFGAITAAQTNSGYVFLALGKPKVISVVGLFIVLLQIPLLIYFTIHNGVIGAAWAYLAAVTMIMPVFIAILCKYLELKLTELLSTAWRPMLAASFMIFAVLAYRNFSPVYLEESFKIVQLFIVVGIGALVYCTSLYGLWRLSGCPETAEHHILEKLKPSIPLLKRL